MADKSPAPAAYRDSADKPNPTAPARQRSLRQMRLLEARRFGPDEVVRLVGPDLSEFMAEVAELARLIRAGAAARLGFEQFGEATLGLIEGRLGLPLIDSDLAPAGRANEVRLIGKPSKAFREFMAALRAGEAHA